MSSQQIYKYNPAFLTDSELRESFVVREVELETALGVFYENVSDSNQHVLITGPRGSGKTSLVQRVALELLSEQTLRDAWHPIQFAEESYEVTTPGEFWLEAAFHLSEATSDPKWKKAYEEISNESSEDRMRERALGMLLDFSDQQQKRLVLLVENLDMLLCDQVSKDDAWTLRHTLQNEKRIMLFASATTRFEELNESNNAMYEIFRHIPLAPLNTDQCREFWKKRTGESLANETIRPIEILTGGNFRLLTILASFAAKVSLRQLMNDLTHLVDEHTEYFKSHLDRLAVIERKVLLALADLWEPATASEVAAKARLEVSKTSSYLNRLLNRGAVTILPDGKRTNTYQVAERLYNIYYLLRRRGGASNRVRAVVRFIIDFYDQDRLISTARSIANELKELPCEYRNDHYHAYSELLRLSPRDTARSELIRVAREELMDLTDLPPSLAALVTSQSETGSSPTQEELEKEEASLRDAILSEPGSAVHWCALAIFLQHKAGRFEDSEEAYRKAINLDSENALVWFALGVLLSSKLSRYDEGEKAYRKAIELAPEFALNWAQLGALLHEKLSRYDEAEEAYRKALELNPEYEWVELQLGSLHEKLSRYDEAEEAYRRVLELNPETEWGWVFLGRLFHEKLSRYDEAEEAYRKAIDIDSEISLGWAWANLGELLHENLSRFDEAEEAYRRALELDPEYEWVWVQLGQLLHENFSRYDEAEKAYRKAIDIDSEFAGAWGQLGELLHENLSRYDEAEEAYRKVIELLPEFAWGWLHLIKLFSETDREEELEELLTDTGKYGPDLLDGLAWQLFEFGDSKYLEHAARLALNASEHRDATPHVWLTLAAIQCRQGELENSIVSMKRYLLDHSVVAETLDDAISLAIELTAKGKGAEARDAIVESESAMALEPLAVGISLFLGEKIRAPVEIVEVAKDIEARIKEYSTDKSENRVE